MCLIFFLLFCVATVNVQCLLGVILSNRETWKRVYELEGHQSLHSQSGEYYTDEMSTLGELALYWPSDNIRRA